MAEINLLDSQTHTNNLKAQGSRWLLRIMTIIFVASLLSYALLLFLNWSTGKKITEATDAIVSYQNESKNNKDREELITRQGQLNNINSLLAAHLYWSKLLPELARVTLTSAYYSTMTASADGSLDLTVNTPSYSEAEKYLQVFDLPEYNKEFSNVKVMSMSKSQQGNALATTMRLHLTLNPDFLKK